MDLRAPAHLVSPRAKAYWMVRAGFAVVVVLAAEIVWLVLSDENPWWRWLLLVVTAVLGLSFLIVMPQWRYRVHRWEVTPTAVYTQTGWVTQERRIAPISRVQTVDTARGPLAQLFRLSTVTVTTASSAGALHIEGLDRQVAAELVDHLTIVTEQSEDDAT